MLASERIKKCGNLEFATHRITIAFDLAGPAPSGCKRSARLGRRVAFLTVRSFDFP
jgi:hypothetical protein